MARRRAKPPSAEGGSREARLLRAGTGSRDCSARGGQDSKTHSCLRYPRSSDCNISDCCAIFVAAGRHGLCIHVWWITAAARRQRRRTIDVLSVHYLRGAGCANGMHGCDLANGYAIHRAQRRGCRPQGWLAVLDQYRRRNRGHVAGGLFTASGVRFVGNDTGGCGSQPERIRRGCITREKQRCRKSKIGRIKIDPASRSTEFQSTWGWCSESWILPIMLFSGVATFSYEVLWTRLLAHILGGSVVAFATMLASFLAGIAIGSAIASRIAKTRAIAQAGFIIAQLGTALTCIAIYLALDRYVPQTAGLLGNVTLAIAFLLPATFFIGATFPFAVRILSRDESEASIASARVYSWNTVGAIVGAVVAGFVLIPNAEV